RLCHCYGPQDGKRASVFVVGPFPGPFSGPATLPVATEDFAARSGSGRLPGGLADPIADEPNRAIGKPGIDAARVHAASVIDVRSEVRGAGGRGGVAARLHQIGVACIWRIEGTERDP